MDKLRTKLGAECGHLISVVSLPDYSKAGQPWSNDAAVARIGLPASDRLMASLSAEAKLQAACWSFEKVRVVVIVTIKRGSRSSSKYRDGGVCC